MPDTPDTSLDTSAAGAPSGGTLAALVDALAPEIPEGRREFPSLPAIVEVLEWLRSVLFPGHFGSSEVSTPAARYTIGATLDRVARGLEEQLRRVLILERVEDAPQAARRTTWALLRRLPDLQRLLRGDAEAAYEGDPAAHSPDEAIFCYPGVFALTNHRIAHELYLLGIPFLPRIIAEYSHGMTGIDIHPGARIGERFFIDHGTGVVIGETCVIGNRVRLYQGVTLGAKSLPLDPTGLIARGNDRHPIVEDDVIIYSNATILGRITIGRRSTIGGNVWLTRSVPPNSVVTQSPSREGFERGGGI